MHMQMEKMETRVLFAVTASFDAGTGVLSVVGDDLDNQIVVSRDAAGAIFVNGGAVPIAGDAAATVANTVRMQLLGGGGDDSISLDETAGALPAAQLLGEAGSDTLTGGSGADTLVGHIGDDELRGMGGTDDLQGNEGDDLLIGGAGNDTVSGHADDDRLVWNPFDGSDLNEGGDGIDTIEVNGTDGAEQFTTTANGTRVRFDRLNAGAFFLDIGTAEHLSLRANGGDDSFSAVGNLAALIRIAVDGGVGNDTLLGSNGPDELTGGNDDDFLDGQQGNDSLLMGAGDDTFQWDPGDGLDVVEGQAGNDRILFNGSNIGEIFEASANAGRLRFTRNIGTIALDVDDVERVRINAVGGADTLTVNDLTGTDVADIDFNAASVIGGSGGDAQIDTIVLNGTAGGDNFTATENAGAIVAATAAVRVNATHWELTNDKILFNGLAGPDTLIVNGGDEGDQFAVAPSGTSVRVTRSNLTAYLVEAGATENLVINGLDGNDAITASGDVAALVQLSIDGGAGHDTIGGGNGADALIGGAGDDRIDGHQGADVVFLGIGDDTFVWNGGDGADVIEGEAGADRIVFHGDPGDENVEFSAEDGRARFFWNLVPTTVDFAGIESASYNALAGADLITVTDMTGSGVTSVTLNLAAAPAGQAGDAQTDEITLLGTNAADDVAVTSATNGIQVTGLGATVSVLAPDATHDRVNIHALGGADTVAINALAAPAVQQVAVDVGGADGAVDRIVVNADDSANNITVTDVLDGTVVTGLTARVLVRTTEQTLDALRINAGSGADVVSVNQAGTGGGWRNVTVDGGAGTDTINVAGTAFNGHATVAPSAGSDAVVVSPGATGLARVRFDESQHLASLTVNSGGLAVLTLGGAKVLSMNALAINGTGKLDLTDNSAVIDYTGSSPMAAVQQRLSSGFNGGAWNGLGIISSTAAARSDTGIGYAEASDLFSAFPATFRGQSIDDTAILLTHTFYGDADLNRAVNLDDFNRLAANFGATGRRWAHGDSNYDQNVNLDDFNRLASNFGRSAGAAAAAGLNGGSGEASKRVADDVLEL